MTASRQSQNNKLLFTFVRCCSIVAIVVTLAPSRVQCREVVRPPDWRRTHRQIDPELDGGGAGTEEVFRVMSSAHGGPTAVTLPDASQPPSARNGSDDESATTPASFLAALTQLIAVLENSTSSGGPGNLTSATKDGSDEGGMDMGSARNLASWLKDSLMGSSRRWWNRRQATSSNQGHKTHFQPHPHHQHHPGHNFLIPTSPFLPPPSRFSAPPPHPGFGHPGPGFVPNFLPSPEGFPSPYSPDSVMISPELLQDSGIDYWLNFIEQQAQQGDRNGGSGSGGGGGGSMSPPSRASGSRPTSKTMASKPIGIGEKIKRPSSIRDELLLQDNEDEDEYGGDGGHGHHQYRPSDVQQQPSMSPSSATASTANDKKQPEVFSPRCDRFVESICLEDFEYPEQAIVDEVYKRREIFELLYSEDGSKDGPPLVDGIPRDVEESYTYTDAGGAATASSTQMSKGRSGYVCASEVLYGKPKLARNKDGNWKVIVNAGEFTQTLRMEKCLKPNGRCNYIIPQMETRCAQVHSMHRLMVFEKGRGFFVDSFKIPTGCSCQVIRRKPDAAATTFTSNSYAPQAPKKPQPTYHQPAPSSQFDDFLAMTSPPLLKPPRLPARPQVHQQQPSFQSSRPSSSPLLNSGQPGPTQAQLSNTLWSILMGTNQGEGGGVSPQLEESLQSQLGLIQHLKATYPQLAAHISPESVLNQLTGGMDSGSRPNGNGHRPMFHHHHPSSNGGRFVFPNGQTTTIVNPNGLSGGGGGGSPVVQVIHVPVTSNGGGMPQPVYRPNKPDRTSFDQSPLFLGMAAYESKASGTSAELDQTTPTSVDKNSSSLNSYLSSAKGAKYTPTGSGHKTTPPPPPGPEPDDEDDEEEYAEDDGSFEDVKFTPIDKNTKRPILPVERPNGQQNQQRPTPLQQPQVNKRMLDKKINFNYHPILEYIPTSSDQDKSGQNRNHNQNHQNRQIEG